MAWTLPRFTGRHVVGRSDPPNFREIFCWAEDWSEIGRFEPFLPSKPPQRSSSSASLRAAAHAAEQSARHSAPGTPAACEGVARRALPLHTRALAPFMRAEWRKLPCGEAQQATRPLEVLSSSTTSPRATPSEDGLSGRSVTAAAPSPGGRAAVLSCTASN